MLDEDLCAFGLSLSHRLKVNGRMCKTDLRAVAMRTLPPAVTNKPEVGFMSCRILYLIGQLHSRGSKRQIHYLVRNMDWSRYRLPVAVWNFSEEDIYIPLFQMVFRRLNHAA